MLANFKLTYFNMNYEILLIGIIMIIFTLIILFLSEIWNINIKREYEDQYGYNSWKNVLYYSLSMGLLSGLLTGFVTYAFSNELFLYLINFSTIIGYIGAQSVCTDEILHKVDRHLLRISYIDTFLLTLVYLINYNQLLINGFSVLLIYLVLFLFFIFSSMGASDIRVFIVIFPFLIAVNKYYAIATLIIVTFITVVHMTIVKHKKKDKMYKVPIVPYLTIPYIFLIPIFPFFMIWVNN